MFCLNMEVPHLTNVILVKITYQIYFKQFLSMISAFNLFYCLCIVISYVDAMNKTGVFTILTEGCTIPGFPLINDRIRNLVGPPKRDINCSAKQHLVTNNSSHVWVIKEALPYYNIWSESEFYCCYRHFSVAINGSNVVYGSCKDFTSIIPADDEYIRIECYYLDDKIYDDFFIFPSKGIINRSSTISRDSYNVLILGIESVSRMNFHRTMPITSTYLLNKGFLELFGYNKLGDNSFPNLFPAFTGISFKDVKEVYQDNIDLSAFIWDKFQKAGYYTGLGSDSTAGLFGTYESSFQSIPTDFYLQPFFTEARTLYKNKDYDYHQCVGSKFSFKLLLNYIYELTVKLKSDKLFGIFWEESITHQEDVNNPRIMDEDYYNLLNDLDKDNYLNKTVLILLSDHGMRWGEIVQTVQGRLEERLPFLSILFPSDFRTNYKLAFNNFLLNTYRLTTPFDIYETILDLLNLNSITDLQIMKRSQAQNSTDSKSSLFLPVSEKRTCQSLSIDEHWCTCYKGKKVKPGNKMRATAAKHLIRHVNDLLRAFPQCRKLKLKHVLDCYVVKNSRREQTYTVIIRTVPGGALFDGTLVQDPRAWVVSGTVSRLNLYRNQSYCVDDYLIKMYCYCG